MKPNEASAALFGSSDTDLRATDPEFTSLFTDFAFGEVPQDLKIDAHDAALAVLASLMGSQALDVFSRLLPLAYDEGVTELEVREMIYQGTAYLGIGRTLPFLQCFNETRGPGAAALPSTGTTTAADRVEKGEAVQVGIFGDGMRGFASSGPEDVRHINRWLSGNCFGDYYTRGGLSVRLREMCTFCYISAQGGCEPQLTAHAKGNFNVGNSREYLIGIISACLPYIGYPRSLNALRCVNEAAGSQ